MADQLFLLEAMAEAVEVVPVVRQEMLLELQTQVGAQEAVLL